MDKIGRTLVCTIATAGSCTCLMPHIYQKRIFRVKGLDWNRGIGTKSVRDARKRKHPFSSQGTCLLSVSASRGSVFRRYLLNKPIDQDEIWTQEVSVCDLFFHNILNNKKSKFQGLAIGS